MAAVLNALAPYVKKLMMDMAEEKVYMLLGVSAEIRKLEDNVESLKSFLTDAEKRRITDQSVQRWVTKFKDSLYVAMDILDLCQLKAEERRDSMLGSGETRSGCFDSFLFCLRNPVFAHKIGSRIKELNQRLADIQKGATTFKFNINLDPYTYQRILTDAEHSKYKTTSEFRKSSIVGEKIDKDTKELVQVLIDDNPNIKVVSIVGMGGIGKTTLAQKIFNDTAVIENFKTKIWLTSTQNFDEVELLRTAISHAGGHHGGEQDKSLLVRTLTNTLSVSKFMLVMDDVWSDKAWNHVLSVPAENASQKQPGSRVLVTTRFEDVARQMRSSFHQHHVGLLDKDDAWSLLKKQLPPDQVVGIDQLKDIGMQIINKCDGLPLAIKVMGGLLSTKYPSEREWGNVLNDPAWSVAGLPEELDNRLYLSYENLSPQLKQCFLYCSIIPKGDRTRRSLVIPMWISEGFIQPLDSRSSHDDRLEVAIEYYRELIMRNLIEPTENTLSGTYCTMHDVVRSFAQFMAREESSVIEDEHIVAEPAPVGDRSNSTSLVRRISIALGPTVSLSPEYWAILQKQESLRTLIIDCSTNFKPSDSLSSFSGLRVLYISYADGFDSLVDSLCHLKHLRYLHLDAIDISRLPDDIDKMKLLEHIILFGCRKLSHLPGRITKLTRLRRLAMEDFSDVVPKGFRGLTNLRSLFGFPVHMDKDGRSWCSLEELGPLSQLRQLRLVGLGNLSASFWAGKAIISSKTHLSYLQLKCNTSVSWGPDGELERQGVIEDVLYNLCPPVCLETLVMQKYFGRQLPNWMWAPTAKIYKSLRYMDLVELTCCTQLPDGLCQFPSLESLIISNAPAINHIRSEFQGQGRPFTSGALSSVATLSAFPKLKYLLLDGLCQWEVWEWNEDDDEEISAIAMPALETLHIDNCKLTHLPPGLASNKRHALRELNLYGFTNLASVDNFPSVVKLDVFDCPKLRRISGLSMLQKISISCCPNMEVLEGVPAIDSLVIWDPTMERLPGYLQSVNPRYLDLSCSKNLYDSLLPGTSERGKISHIRTLHISFTEDSDEDSMDGPEDIVRGSRYKGVPVNSVVQRHPGRVFIGGQIFSGSHRLQPPRCSS